MRTHRTGQAPGQEPGQVPGQVSGWVIRERGQGSHRLLKASPNILIHPILYSGYKHPHVGEMANSSSPI